MMFYVVLISESSDMSEWSVAHIGTRNVSTECVYIYKYIIRCMLAK